MKPRSRHALAFSCLFAALPAAAQTPDPIALLRGAEGARRAIQSGEIEFTVDEAWGGQKPRTTVVRVTFDGAKRTVRLERDEFISAAKTKAEVDVNKKRLAALNYDWDRAAAAGLGRKEHRRTSQAYDGSQFCWYRTGPHMNASYRKMENDGEMTFNPQTLGLVNLYHKVVDLSYYFSNGQAKNIALMGKEFIGSTAAWHIQFDLASRFHFWIEDRQPFRVSKVECVGVGTSEGYRSTITSTFQDGGSPLPVRVEVKEMTPKGIEMESTLIVHSVKLNVPVDPNVGTLASLELPAGVDVLDTFADKKVLGVWEGDKIVPKEDHKSRAAGRWPARQQIFAGSGALTLLVGSIAFLWWRHRRSVAKRLPPQAVAGPPKTIHS
jgi:hypothetical protein